MDTNIDFSEETEKLAMKEARSLWNESEWVLNFLRTEEGKQRKRATDREVLEWIVCVKRQSSA